MAARKKTRGTGATRTRSAARSRAVPKPQAPKLDRALRAVAAVLDQLEEPSAVIGGVAVIIWGFARTTGDIDCAIAAPLEAIERISRTFRAAGFAHRIDDAVDFARQNHVLLLRDRATEVDLDVSFSQGGFEHEALERAVSRPFGGTRVRVPSVTDLVIYKMIAGRERDTRDVHELLPASRACSPTSTRCSKPTASVTGAA